MLPRVTYDRLLLLDLNPKPDYPHVTCVSYANSGLPVVELESSRFTREFRLTARDLPIYDGPGHVYYVMAKMESDCTAAEEHRATHAINEFVAERRKAGVRLDRLPDEIADNFKSRVQRRVPYVHKDDRDVCPAPRQTARRKRPMVSSSDPEGPAAPPPPAKTLGIAARKGAGAKASKSRVEATSGPKPVVETPAAAVDDTTNSQLFEVPVSNNPMQPNSGLLLATGDTPVVLESEMVPFRQPSLPAPRRSDTPPPPRLPTGSQTPHTHPLPFFSSPAAGGSPAPTSQRSQSDGLNASIAKLLERIDSMDRRIEKKHTRFLESFQYLVGSVDSVSRDVSELRDSLKKLTTPLLAKELEFITSFPLQSAQEVDEYVERDPKLTHMISR